MNLNQTIAEHVDALPHHMKSEVLDFILFLESKQPKKSVKIQKKHSKKSQELADALDLLVKLDPFSDIQDPVAWQREQRKDRVLPVEPKIDFK